jgi:hypothetical protein
VDAGVEEFDLEGAVRHWPRLPDKLIASLFLHASPTSCVHVETVVRAGRRATDLDPEENGTAVQGRCQNKVKIAGVKTVGNAARCAG